ncbi:ChaB family protein [Kineococcus rhizosphaerae]|uniref:Rho termination factor-like protein n=1 Tax=Kineococcus rhizosphaerae TaxID=559628 RepID=A0A2T0QYL4_9ACTN|nr:ChaB family protein [Kineococcus rhizosphaerae]PRY11461.1 Rho termination factor-like protein [Kineococcus rhizosphaerae]
MPKTTGGGKPVADELPSTLQRSDAKAQATYAKAHDAAEEQYDDAQRANRVAWAAVKHTHEKVGDHWQPKEDGRKGPSDPQSEGGVDTHRRTSGGVDEHATKEHLLQLARELDVRGRSSMTKAELVDALRKANDRATRASR